MRFWFFEFGFSIGRRNTSLRYLYWAFGQKLCWQCVLPLATFARMRAVETILGPARHFPVRITLANGERHVIPHPFNACINPYNQLFCFCPDEPYEFSRAIPQSDIVAVEPIGLPIGDSSDGHWLVAE